MNLGSCSMTRVERVVVIGLHIVWERGYRRVHVQLDLCIVIQVPIWESEIKYQQSSEIANFTQMILW
ncbi:hypothetical protein LINPERPRIM_LOCUS43648 [Linum perenne]